MAGNGRNKTPWIRLSGIGFEFVAALGVFAFLGYWLVDRNYDTWPWGLVIGTVLGLMGGTYNLIRQSMSAFDSLEPSKKPDNDTDSPSQ